MKTNLLKEEVNRKALTKELEAFVPNLTSTKTLNRNVRCIKPCFYSVKTVKDSYILTLRHVLLSYSEGEKKKVPWIELRFLYKKAPYIAGEIHWLASVLNLKFFKDFKQSHFLYVKEEISLTDLKTAACYVNPDYKRGYREDGAFLSIEELMNL